MGFTGRNGEGSLGSIRSVGGGKEKAELRHSARARAMLKRGAWQFEQEIGFGSWFLVLVWLRLRSGKARRSGGADWRPSASRDACPTGGGSNPNPIRLRRTQSQRGAGKKTLKCLKSEMLKGRGLKFWIFGFRFWIGGIANLKRETGNRKQETEKLGKSRQDVRNRWRRAACSSCRVPRKGGSPARWYQ
jgi:hypothetical protein